MSSVTNAGSTDAEILARAKTTVTLAGQEYVWEEMGRRQSRAMLQEMIPIANLANDGMSNPSRALKAIDETLDFFYRHHAKMRGDRKFLDDNASNEEVIEAFRKVQELIDVPFQRDRIRAEQTVTPNPASTSS